MNYYFLTATLLELTWIDLQKLKSEKLEMNGEFNQDTLSQQTVYCTVLEDFSIKGGITDGGSGRRLNCCPEPNRVALLY